MRQIEELTTTGELLAASDIEKEVNRRILLALGALGLALTGSWWFPPLLIGAVAGAVYTTLPLYLEAYRSVVKRRKVNLSVVAGLNLIEPGWADSIPLARSGSSFISWGRNSFLKLKITHVSGLWMCLANNRGPCGCL